MHVYIYIYNYIYVSVYIYLIRMMFWGHVFGAGHLRGSRLLSFFAFYYLNNIVWGVGGGGVG